MQADYFISYAENHEDVVLARALRPDARVGRWIDVGAGNPIRHSTTAAFSERGWQGVNIEPLPSEYELLCQERPADTNLQVALGSTPGFGKMFIASSASTSTATLVPEMAEQYRDVGLPVSTMEVQIRTLADVAFEYGLNEVDFLRVDAEGTQREVIAGADWSSFRPRVVVVRVGNAKQKTATYVNWESLLVEAGYEFALFDGVNRFYAQMNEPRLVQSLAMPANTLDAYLPYEWLHAVHILEGELNTAREQNEDSTAALSRALAAARYAHDEVSVSAERITELRQELAAAQIRAAQALTDARTMNTNVEVLRATRTYRHAQALHNAYERLRQSFRSFNRDR